MSPDRSSEPFDPRALLGVLDRHHVAFIVIGGLARVIEGADEITRGVDITPSTKPENLRRLADALDELGVGETDLDAEEPTTVMTSARRASGDPGAGRHARLRRSASSGDP